MAGADEGSRIRDAVRDSKIRWDIPLKSDLMFDSVEPEPNRYSIRLRHSFYRDTQLVDGDLPHVAKAEVGGYCHHQKNSLREKNRSWFRTFMPIFDGSPIIEEFWEWIDSIEDYFEETQAPERLKCKLASYTLEGEAESWWLRLQRDRIEEGKLKIYSWTRMKRLLAMEFLHSRCSRKVPSGYKGVHVHSEKPKKRCSVTDAISSPGPSSSTTAKEKGQAGGINYGYGGSDEEEKNEGPIIDVSDVHITDIVTSKGPSSIADTKRDTRKEVLKHLRADGLMPSKCSTKLSNKKKMEESNTLSSSFLSDTCSMEVPIHVSSGRQQRLRNLGTTVDSHHLHSMPVGVQKNVEDGDVAIGAPKHDAYTKNEETENIVEPGNGENNSKDGSSNECFVDKQLKESVEVKPIKCSTEFLFTSESGKQKGISEFEMLSTSLDSYERGENESTEESTLLQPTTNGKISHNESGDIPQSLELLDFVEGLELKNEHILDEGSDSGRDEGPREETLSGQLPKIKDLPMKVFLKAERVEYSVQEESDLEDKETGLEYNVTSINGQLPKDIFVLPHWPKRFWELIYVLNNHDIKLSLEVRIDINMERITWLTGVVVIMKSFNDDNNSLTCLNLGDRMVSSSIVQTALLLFLFDPGGSHISQKFGDYLFPNYDILFENEMTDAAALLNNAHLGGEIKVPTCVIGKEYIYVISISKGLGKVGVDTAIADIVGGEMLIIFCQHFVVVAYSNFPLLGQPMKPYSDDDQHQAREGRINMSHLFVTHIHRSSNRLPATISIVLCWIHVYGIERSSHIYNLLAGAVVTYGMVLHDGEVRSTNNNNPYITIPLSQVTFGFLTNTDSRNTAISVVYVGDNTQNIIETWFDLLCFHEKSLGGSIVFFMIHKNCTAMKYIANMLVIVYSDLVHYSDAKIWPKEYMLKVMNEALTEEMGGSDSDGMDYRGLAQKYFLKEMEKELTGSPDITNMLNLIEAKNALRVMYIKRTGSH